ncbi:hypothetical protein TRFO_35244 [Tritrichomonas foetus]|uniref:Uncharacterized protein n=1 Tax=Tritrichomonas foetus TaxID=1144522 RepID=A0A1J4JGW1_9EUKA|nr:hypothetical protein TRFO_35244 [Tritrichomonas foetus]|eukprot:OHS98394.1 hypothetical protein TRFO_35244 [Tritrichomonas foetus]
MIHAPTKLFENTYLYSDRLNDQMTEQLYLLKDELQKLTGIRTPKELRVLCQEAIDSISALNLPITKIDNPVMTCLTTLFAKYEKQSKSIVPVICECIISHCFSKSALSSLTSSLLLRIDCIEWKTVQNLSQFLQTSILENFPDVTVVQSYFSIVLQLMASNDSNISGVSYAAFQSMLDILIDAISKAKKEVPPEFLSICTDIFGMNSEMFEKPLYFILFLIFNDLSCISVNQKMRFLTCQKVPTKLIFDVLEMILNDYPTLFQECPQLGSVFESTVIQSMEDTQSLPFISAFVNSCYSSHYSLCLSIFSEFLENWKNDVFSSLFLFYSIFLPRKSGNIESFKLVTHIFVNEDGLKTFVHLFKRIHDNFDLNFVPQEEMEFTLKLKSFSRALAENQGNNSFIFYSPFEITFCVINAFASAFESYQKSKRDSISLKEQNNNTTSESENDSKFMELFQYVGHDLVDLYFYALKYSSMGSFDMVSKNFLSFLKISQIKFDNFEKLINFDSLCDSQNMTANNRQIFHINEKKSRWDRTLNKIASYCPKICEENWTILFASLFAVSEEDVDLSPSFAKKFDNETTQKVLSSLVLIRPFPHTFINDFLISNIDRFDVLWPILDHFFDQEIGKNSKIDDKIFELFIDLILKAFVSQTEWQLLELGAKILKSTKSVTVDKKILVLKELRNVFAENSQELKTGFPFLFEILDPEIYDGELLTAAFSLFNVVCSEFIHIADPKFVRPCLELVFKFSQQTKDINISLSSFDLVWNLVTNMEKNDDNWTHFLFKISDMFFDDRTDVALCSVKTFFTYLNSYFSIISRKTIDYFLNRGFESIINRFDSNNQKSISIIQPILYEICHFMVTFWKEVGHNYNFDIYLQKNEAIIINCDVNDTIIASFQFYDCICSSTEVIQSKDDELHHKILTSLRNISDKKISKIENINCAVVSQFGRLFGNILKSFKNRLEVVPYLEYLDFIRHAATFYKNDKFVHFTTQRMLDALASTFPLPQPNSDQTIEFLFELYEKGEDVMKKLICYEFREIFELIDDKQNLIFKCKNLIISEFGEKFAETFVKSKLDWQDEEKDQIKALLNEIKEKFPALKENVEKRIQELE